MLNNAKQHKTRPKKKTLDMKQILLGIQYAERTVSRAMKHLEAPQVWFQPAGLNVGCNESDIFFLKQKKKKEKKNHIKKNKQKKRTNSCSRAKTPRPKTAGGQRLMHLSDSSLRGTMMTPRHQKEYGGVGLGEGGRGFLNFCFYFIF